MNQYFGHETQVYGIEEHRLVGGKGDGMRLLEVRNANGLEAVISPDRNADISRLRFRGQNLSYFSPCGYAAPAYYESEGTNFLKSFTAGFLTTCGLQAVGNPCTDQGEVLPLHGSIANTPADHVQWEEEDGNLVIRTRTPDEQIFGRKLVLSRTFAFPIEKNEFTFTDVIENRGDHKEPFEILYHMNMGYPMLDEDSIVRIASDKVTPRNTHAAEDIKNWMNMEKPTPGYEERCYYHEMKKCGHASIFQPKKKIGLAIDYNAEELDCFVEWKMMGVRDYVLGLECGNAYPDGRNIMREKGILKFLAPGEKKTYSVKITMMEKEEKTC
ncbi:MAG: aldose 1-epimerase family protein [Lachnospiraceae bacterium]|jgi:hypothetical protein|nr:aldose 1-epimerase family protein [Lachnospiraceae bacterium]